VWGTPEHLKHAARRTDKEVGELAKRRNDLVPMHTIYNVYTVGGMTCRHCAATVSAELSGMDAVTDVAVNLATGTVTVASAHELSHHLVETAVAHAGYQLVD
jgi:copper chaperone CopZ